MYSSPAWRSVTLRRVFSVVTVGFHMLCGEAAFGAALLLLPCGVFEACGDAPQNRGEALTLACVPCYVFFVAGELPEWMNPARVVAWVSGAPLRRAV